MEKINVSMKVNGKNETLSVEPRTLLVHALREHLEYTGAHIGCSSSHCGACTVDMNGKSVKSCTIFAPQAEGADILTVEGIGTPDKLHVIQEMFKEHHGLQCGYCTPGMIMRSYRFLQENPNPTEEEVRFGISGNLCRCTGYQNIVKSRVRFIMKPLKLLMKIKKLMRWQVNPNRMLFSLVHQLLMHSVKYMIQIIFS